MSIPPPLDRERLGKSLSLLGSDHAGERDAAGLAAHRLVAANGLTWAELLRPPADPLQRRPHDADAFAAGPPPSPHLLILWCIERGGFLSKFERNYLHSLVQHGWCRRLTRKEQAVVDDIVTKIHVGLRGSVS